MLGLLPVAGILAHFALVLFLLSAVVRVGRQVRGAEWTEEAPGETLAYVVLAMLGVFAVRLLVHIWRAIVALVTPVHDIQERDVSGVPLANGDSPEILRVVREVCDRVGAPLPDEIRIAHLPECYAAELREFGVRTRRRLIVVLGLPHLVVLNVSEIKVILAHELSHIALGDTRVEVFTYRFVDHLRHIAMPSRPAWWRRLDPVLWICLGTFHLLCRLAAPVRRQNELRADSVSSAAYGGELAARTLLKDWLLNHEFHATVASFEHGLPLTEPVGDNVYARLASRWRELSAAGRAYLERRLAQEEETSFWDTHPTVTQRLRLMRQYGDNESEDVRPARAALPDFEELCARLHPLVFGS